MYGPAARARIAVSTDLDLLRDTVSAITADLPGPVQSLFTGDGAVTLSCRTLYFIECAVAADQRLAALIPDYSSVSLEIWFQTLLGEYGHTCTYVFPRGSRSDATKSKGSMCGLPADFLESGVTTWRCKKHVANSAAKYTPWDFFTTYVSHFPEMPAFAGMQACNLDEVASSNAPQLTCALCPRHAGLSVVTDSIVALERTTSLGLGGLSFGFDAPLDEADRG
jgi:hypothetical protein